MSATDAAKEEAKGLLMRWRAERREIVGEVRELQSRSLALGKMIDGMETLYPDLKGSMFAEITGHQPSVEVSSEEPIDADEHAELGETAADVARVIVRENPDKWFTTGDMVKEFAARQHPATPTAIRLALRRTWETGLTDRRGAGRGQSFRLAPASTDAVLGGLEE